MLEDKDVALPIIAHGYRTILRGWLASDVDPFIRWMVRGEWRLFDAPWEGFRGETTAECEKRDREWLLDQIKGGDRSGFHSRAVIATPNNIPIGWVNRYGDKDNPHACFVGIDICEDAYLNLGLGTEALELWVNHIFTTSDVRKIGLETWSFNLRMIRIAEEAGFVYKGCQRGIRQWQGEWLDLLQFGMLREEWQQKVGVEDTEEPEHMAAFFDARAAGTTPICETAFCRDQCSHYSTRLCPRPSKEPTDRSTSWIWGVERDWKSRHCCRERHMYRSPGSTCRKTCSSSCAKDTSRT
jgi:RimJ/RimL family protein N-acetyltransferase